MTGDELIAAGRRLARACVYLRTAGEDFAALWGGEGIVPCGDGPYRHWLTIDCRHIPAGGSTLSGMMSIYTNEEDCETGVVAVSDAPMPPDTAGGTKLFAHPGRSLPPIDAVFKFGSPEVGRWLASNHWRPEWAYNANFPDRTPVDVYEREYQGELPLYRGDAHAVLGGWHMPWPEGDWDELVDKRLIAWTFEEAEPWVEVWEDEGGFRVIQRIT
jgi:hypothetical protein